MDTEGDRDKHRGIDEQRLDRQLRWTQRQKWTQPRDRLTNRQRWTQGQRWTKTRQRWTYKETEKNTGTEMDKN